MFWNPWENPETCAIIVLVYLSVAVFAIHLEEKYLHRVTQLSNSSLTCKKPYKIILTIWDCGNSFDFIHAWFKLNKTLCPACHLERSLKNTKHVTYEKKIGSYIPTFPICQGGNWLVHLTPDVLMKMQIFVFKKNVSLVNQEFTVPLMEHYRFVNNTTCFLVLCDVWNSTVMLYSNTDHCVKIVRVRSYSDPLFYAFGLNIERYYGSLRIQSECGKMRTRITPNADTVYTVYYAECLLFPFCVTQVRSDLKNVIKFYWVLKSIDPKMTVFSSFRS